MMPICKLPNIKCYYWHAGKYLGNERIRYVLTRTRFLEILEILHFVDKNTSDTSDKGYKLRSVIKHLNVAFQAALCNADWQSIDKNITNFDGHHSCEQYIKNKPHKMVSANEAGQQDVFMNLTCTQTKKIKLSLDQLNRLF